MKENGGLEQDNNVMKRPCKVTNSHSYSHQGQAIPFPEIKVIKKISIGMFLLPDFHCDSILKQIPAL